MVVPIAKTLFYADTASESTRVCLAEYAWRPGFRVFSIIRDGSWRPLCRQRTASKEIHELLPGDLQALHEDGELFLPRN